MSSPAAGFLVRGSQYGNRAGYLLRLVHVISAADVVARISIGGLLKALHRHATAALQFPQPPSVGGDVCTAVLNGEDS